ncbi:MAG TPA: hypothetical protein VMV31_02585 [Terriglobales bacterium]|nr:hypothetical protein [Terriglobales bacterium]
MKTAIAIVVVAALLAVASVAPLRNRLEGALLPVVARAEASLNQRYPALHAIGILLLHREAGRAE